jgi:hypothetical protein
VEKLENNKRRGKSNKIFKRDAERKETKRRKSELWNEKFLPINRWFIFFRIACMMLNDPGAKSIE